MNGNLETEPKTHIGTEYAVFKKLVPLPPFTFRDLSQPATSSTLIQEQHLAVERTSALVVCLVAI